MNESNILENMVEFCIELDQKKKIRNKEILLIL